VSRPFPARASTDSECRDKGARPRAGKWCRKRCRARESMSFTGPTKWIGGGEPFRTDRAPWTPANPITWRPSGRLPHRVDPSDLRSIPVSLAGVGRRFLREAETRRKSFSEDFLGISRVHWSVHREAARIHSSRPLSTALSTGRCGKAGTSGRPSDGVEPRAQLEAGVEQPPANRVGGADGAGRVAVHAD